MVRVRIEFLDRKTGVQINTIYETVNSFDDTSDETVEYNTQSTINHSGGGNDQMTMFNSNIREIKTGFFTFK
jgi:hypothetical protein